MHGATLRVLKAMLDNGPDRRLYGLQLMDAASVKSGTLYPILDRLEDAGWIAGEWGDDRGHPRRRYYQLTGLGVAEATANIARRSGIAAPKPRLA